MAIDRIQTAIRFTEETMLKIAYIARKNHRSLNAELAFLAQNCIEKFESEYGEIQLSDEEKNKYRR